MSASWLATNIISAVLLPPLVFILPSMAGFLMRKRWPRFGAVLCIAPLLVLIVFSTGAGARWAAASIEGLATPLASAQASRAQAIVVLGGGRARNAPEYGGLDVPRPVVLARLRYAAKLHRETGLPILVTGGTPEGSPESEAALMARTLRDDFAIEVKWQEGASDNTAQNAQYSAQQLRSAGIKRILLVTDAMHMARSVAIFSRHDLQVVQAPTGFYSSAPLSAIDFVPKAHWIEVTAYAMHEWIGLVWYRLRHGSTIPLMRNTIGVDGRAKHTAS
jgi:uncharacterized SAM-binding protein YcdF (DUF218 family)